MNSVVLAAVFGLSDYPQIMLNMKSRNEFTEKWVDMVHIVLNSSFFCYAAALMVKGQDSRAIPPLCSPVALRSIATDIVFVAYRKAALGCSKLCREFIACATVTESALFRSASLAFRFFRAFLSGLGFEVRPHIFTNMRSVLTAPLAHVRLRLGFVASHGGILS